ncbi:MAG: hypothetical protein JXJ22_09595 [Bacteroidales bacterium]|nr:hypothetical protein [Bacteroidales bacterium]
MTNSIYSNILLIAGDGQNVGKTTLACNIINKFSRQQDIIAIKISPHFHKVTEDAKVLVQTENYIILEETDLSSKKDSSLMLQSGAAKVFFIMVNDNFLNAALQHLFDSIEINTPMVIESGGLRKVLQPGVFLFVRMLCCRVKNLDKIEYSKVADKIITNNGHNFDFGLNELKLENNEWKLQQNGSA